MFKYKILLTNIVIIIIGIDTVAFSRNYAPKVLVRQCKVMGMDDQDLQLFFLNPNIDKIKKLYRKKAKECHPDINDPSGSVRSAQEYIALGQEFVALNEAKCILFEYVQALEKEKSFSKPISTVSKCSNSRSTSIFSNFSNQSRCNAFHMYGVNIAASVKHNLNYRQSFLRIGWFGAVACSTIYSFNKIKEYLHERSDAVQQLHTESQPVARVAILNKSLMAATGLTVAVAVTIAGYKAYHYYCAKSQIKKTQLKN